MPTVTVDQNTMTNLQGENWENGVQKTMGLEYLASAQVSGGTAVFYLTDNGQASSNAVFTNAVFKESLAIWIEDSGNLYNFSNYTLSSDRKSLTLAINKLGFNSANAIVALLGTLGSFLTGANYGAAANGLTVYLRIKGN